MLRQYLDMFLGCPHQHLSFPVITQQDRDLHGPDVQPHVTCLDCGREFWYDWKQMRQTSERPQPIYASRAA